jgi:hypothetical protein
MESVRNVVYARGIPLSPAYHVAFAMRVVSPVEVRALQSAIQALADRHESLRRRGLALTDDEEKQLTASTDGTRLRGRAFETFCQEFDQTCHYDPRLRLDAFYLEQRERRRTLYMHVAGPPQPGSWWPSSPISRRRFTFNRARSKLVSCFSDSRSRRRS